MSSKSVKCRLFVEQPLGGAQQISLTEGQAHYLSRVMRLRAGCRIPVFNGRDGEWAAELQGVGSRMHLNCVSQIHAQRGCPDVWLLMAPLRRSRTEFAVEKAVELGVSRITFVSTDRTSHSRVNVSRLRSIAVEAAEQCGGMAVPRIEGIRPLGSVIGAWPEDRKLIFCDEEAGGERCPLPGPSAHKGSALLIGPEGGFSERERLLIGALENSVRSSLGDRILRAETAVAAALALLNIRQNGCESPPALAAQDRAKI